MTKDAKGHGSNAKGGKSDPAHEIVAGRFIDKDHGKRGGYVVGSNWFKDRQDAVDHALKSPKEGHQFSANERKRIADMNTRHGAQKKQAMAAFSSGALASKPSAKRPRDT
jgi:hypothetical protein